MEYIIIQAIYFFLPAYFANMAPVFFKKTLNKLAKPVDFNKTIRGRRILGDHKTFRGLITGTTLAIIVVLIQTRLYPIPFFKDISLIDYTTSTSWIILFGALQGIGALIGDMVKSFFKRGMNFKPGHTWFPFDQIDFVIFALLATSIIYFPGWTITIILLIISPILHILTRLTGYYLKIDKSKF